MGFGTPEMSGFWTRMHSQDFVPVLHDTQVGKMPMMGSLLGRETENGNIQHWGFFRGLRETWLPIVNQPAVSGPGINPSWLDLSHREQQGLKELEDSLLIQENSSAAGKHHRAHDIKLLAKETEATKIRISRAQTQKQILSQKRDYRQTLSPDSMKLFSWSLYAKTYRCMLSNIQDEDAEIHRWGEKVSKKEPEAKCKCVGALSAGQFKITMTKMLNKQRKITHDEHEDL